MAFEAEYLSLIDFDRELSDLGDWQDLLLALGFDAEGFSADFTATGTPILKIQSPHCLERLRTLAEIAMRGTIH